MIPLILFTEKVAEERTETIAGTVLEAIAATTVQVRRKVVAVVVPPNKTNQMLRP